MANQDKSLWIVVVLVLAGAVVFFLSSKQSPSNKVVMQEAIVQKPVVQRVVVQKTVIPVAVSPVVQRDPVPSPAIVTSPEHGQEAGFAVQVYSFKDQKRADTALANLKTEGYAKAYIEISDLGERGTWYRVRIGGLDNETQAKMLLDTIRKSFKSGIIIKPKA
ncbi:MAG: SPOR domain-containing protein [Candidatus Omnitrophica bacterium]|nr:SPOR domain-containing protein [Candidatus Omnitrophota bacterium]